jgi:dihydroneopterin aldolase
MQFWIYIEGLEFYAYHGVEAEERKIGHRYIADLRVAVEGDAPESDSIKDTVDYAELSKMVVDAARERQFLTLEALAAHLGRRILEEHPLASEVELHLAKRLPPAEIMAEMAGIELTLKRD